ncbi:MAG: urease accessory protein UreD [Cyanophyceae cyanobacterium]
MQPQSESLGWQGNLELVYAHRQGKTRPVQALVQAPLKVQRPFYPEGGVCHSVILHTAGGVVGGDRLFQNIHLQSQAQAVLTTAAAGKIYRSNGAQARQTIDIKIDAGACLEWVPQQTIIFNGAKYRQEVRVELSPGGNWLGWEITRFGRSARGEKFLQGDWRSHTEVWQQGKPLWVDRQWLPAGKDTFFSSHGLNGQPLVGSLIWIGQPVSPEIVTKARSIWNSLHPQGEGGVTQTQGQGILCRYRGASVSEVQSWFMAVWQLLRLSFLQRSAIKPRVWL